MKSINVLVVEDEAVDFALMERSLNRLTGFKADVTFASSLPEARIAARKKKFDTALVDFFLRGECGLDLVPELASRGTGCAPILVTSELTQAVYHRAINGGAIACLAKDKLDPQLLESAIRQGLENQRLLGCLRNSQNEVTRARAEKNMLASHFTGLFAVSLDSLLNSATGLERTVAEDADRSQLMQQASALKTLTKDLHEYCRDTSQLLLEAGAGESNLDLQEILLDAVRIVSQGNNPQAIHFDVALLHHPAPIRANAAILTRAITDLLFSFVAHIISSGRIEIRIAMEEHRVCLCVSSRQFRMQPVETNLGSMLRIARCRELIGQFCGVLDILEQPDQFGFKVLLCLPRRRKNGASSKLLKRIGRASHSS